MSMWDDHDANMLWLDSNYPLDKDPSQPGVNRGPCPEDSGTPEDMESNYPDATVKYFNVKFGDIGSTYPGGIQILIQLNNLSISLLTRRRHTHSHDEEDDHHQEAHHHQA